MTQQEVIKKFQDIGITLCTGGIIDYDTTTMKKSPHSPNSLKVLDGVTKINPKHNILKHRIEKSPYIVIDADGIDLDVLHKIYPTLAKTFFTQTTKPGNRHYYVLPPEGEEWAQINSKGAATHITEHNTVDKTKGTPTYDILKNFNVFESHYPEVNTNYLVDDQYPPARLTQAEFQLIYKLLNANNKVVAHSSIMVINNPIIKQAVAAYLEDKANTKQLNLLINFISSHDYRESQKESPRKKFPPLNHMDFNLIAFKLTYCGLAHEQRDLFLEKLLGDHYGMNLNSPQSKQHLQSIYSTLPRYEEYTAATRDEKIDKLLGRVSYDEVTAPVKYIAKGVDAYSLVHLDTYQFIEMEEGAHTLLPGQVVRLVNESSTFSLTKEQATAYLRSIPRFKLITNPFKPKLWYDDRLDILCLNTLDKSEYYTRATATELKPNNTITKAITSIAGEYEDRYYVWLAHLVFAPTSIQTACIMYTAGAIKGGSGKSALTMHIPIRLNQSSSDIDHSKIKADFSISKSVGHAIYNDIKDPETWAGVLALSKNAMTGGSRSTKSNKYGLDSITEESISMSASMNFVPAIPESDRRSWVLKPQHLEGATEPLSLKEADELHYILEGTLLSVHHADLQELANYLLYVYNNRTDDDERFVSGRVEDKDRTPYWYQCTTADKSYSASLLGSMKLGHLELVSLIDEDGADEYRDLITFMVWQYQQRASHGPVVLPKQWFKAMLELVRSSDEQLHDKTKAIAAALGVESNEFKNRGYAKYKTEIIPGISTHTYKEWSPGVAFQVDIPEDIIETYLEYLSE